MDEWSIPYLSASFWDGALLDWLMDRSPQDVSNDESDEEDDHKEENFQDEALAAGKPETVPSVHYIPIPHLRHKSMNTIEEKSHKQLKIQVLKTCAGGHSVHFPSVPVSTNSMLIQDYSKGNWKVCWDEITHNGLCDPFWFSRRENRINTSDKGKGRAWETQSWEFDPSWSDRFHSWVNLYSARIASHLFVVHLHLVFVGVPFRVGLIGFRDASAVPSRLAGHSAVAAVHSRLGGCVVSVDSGKKKQPGADYSDLANATLESQDYNQQ